MFRAFVQQVQSRAATISTQGTGLPDPKYTMLAERTLELLAGYRTTLPGVREQDVEYLARIMQAIGQ